MVIGLLIKWLKIASLRGSIVFPRSCRCSQSGGKERKSDGRKIQRLDEGNRYRRANTKLRIFWQLWAVRWDLRVFFMSQKYVSYPQKGGCTNENTFLQIYWHAYPTHVLVYKHHILLIQWSTSARKSQQIQFQTPILLNTIRSSTRTEKSSLRGGILTNYFEKTLLRVLHTADCMWSDPQ